MKSVCKIAVAIVLLTSALLICQRHAEAFSVPFGSSEYTFSIVPIEPDPGVISASANITIDYSKCYAPGFICQIGFWSDVFNISLYDHNTLLASELSGFEMTCAFNSNCHPSCITPFCVAVLSVPLDTTTVVIMNTVNCCGIDFGFLGADLTITSDSPLVEISGTTPLPAALPLFASGLGVIGLLGWSRKRKALAA